MNTNPNMVSIRWKLHKMPKLFYTKMKNFFKKTRITFRSLTYNHFMDQSYAADVCMEPLFWFVDNFTHLIGPLFVIAVIALTASVVSIAYWIGLPYWWNRNPYVCVFLLIIGHWLLINICFHYYMAVTVHPGFPPQGELITEAVSICKKCISPKPPRTHHCSVCNRCILKMDHHCPWLNNCVGYRNHRYFFMYMVYMIVGVLFIIVCGFDLAYTELWLHSDSEPEPEGHPVKINKTGAIIPVTDLYVDCEDVPEPLSLWKRRAIVYMALINSGVLVALGGLTIWHNQLIGKGETSIETNINKAESKRFAELGKNYVNPYDFGLKKNWYLFLGLVGNRTVWRHVLLPSAHAPVGDGLTWRTVHDEFFDDWA